jgi:hypothetical protein
MIFVKDGGARTQTDRQTDRQTDTYMCRRFMLSVISAELSATFSASPYLRKMLHFVCVLVTGDVQLCRVFASPHDVHVFIRRFHAKNLEARELCCCANVITVPLTFHGLVTTNYHESSS